MCRRPTRATTTPITGLVPNPIPSIASAEGGRPVAGPLLPARPSRSLAGVLAVAAVMGLLLGRFVTAGHRSAPAVATAASSASADRVASLQTRLAANPDDAAALTQLAVASLARARDTADPSWYRKADQAVERSLALDPASPTTMTAAGLVALGRHDFSGALDWGRRAHAVQPDATEPLAVMVDAYVELGRYSEAVTAAQEMADRRPSLASLARVSYLRELHGDRPGAVAAMTQAATAGAGDAADVATVDVLLGDLFLGAGDVPAARRSYERAVDRVPGLGAAEVGISRADAAGGDLSAAIARLEPLVRRLPAAASVALLGDLYSAVGRTADASAQYDLVRQIERLNRASGVAVDLELARFEADHASPGAVALAETALAQRPTVYAEDALGWALRQAGRPTDALTHARAAVRLGTADAVLWYHVASVEADLGMADEARADLARALTLNPLLTVRDLPPARALAETLGVGP